MKATLIDGLKMMREGLDIVIENLEVSTTQKGKAEPATTKANTAPVEESDTPVTGTLSREQLDGMSYNDLKKLAKSMGIPAVGNRDEITDKILGVEVEIPDDAEVEEEPKPKKSSKRGKTATAPQEVEVDESDNDPLYAQVSEAVTDMSTEDIADLLADVGVSAKGKREALIEKLVQAVRDGLIAFDEDEDEDEGEEIEDTPVANTPDNEDESDEDEDDDVNNIENPNMTEERRNAILAQDKDIRKKISKGKVTREELVDFLQKFYNTDEDLDDMSDEEVVDTYIDAVCRLIDDEGDLIEEGAYSLNGEYACCGRHLIYSEDTEVYICEHCGEEYEIEE